MADFKEIQIDGQVYQVKDETARQSSGGYAPPAGGIPKSDLEQSVQDTLDSVADKVDKVNGKGLSTNDYTDADKAAVGTIANKANDSEVVKSISVNGTPQQKGQNGNVNIQVQAGGESIVFDTDGTPIADGTLSQNSDSVLAAASARWVKEIDNNVKAILADLANIAFTNGKPTWAAVSKRTYTLTMSLSGCSGEVVSGSAGVNLVYEGGVQIKLTPTSGYTFTSVKVNGNDVQTTPTGLSDGSVYVDFIVNQDVTVAATAVSGYAIAVSGAHVTNVQSHSGDTYTVTLGSDNQHFHLPATIVVKHGSTVLTAGTDYTYNQSTGEVVISNVTDNGYSIEVTMVEDAKYTVTLDTAGLTGASAVASAQQVYVGESVVITVTPLDGYTLGNVNYSINGGSQQSATITNNQAVITIANVSENMTVVVSGGADIPTSLNLNLKWFVEPVSPTITAGQPFSLELVPLTEFVAAATQDAGTEGEKDITAYVKVMMNGVDISRNSGVVTYDKTNNKVTVAISNPAGNVTIDAAARVKMKRNTSIYSVGQKDVTRNGDCVTVPVIPIPSSLLPATSVRWQYDNVNEIDDPFNNVISMYKDGEVIKNAYWGLSGGGAGNNGKTIDTSAINQYASGMNGFRCGFQIDSITAIDKNPGVYVNGTGNDPSEGGWMPVLTKDDLTNALFVD